MLGPAIAGAKIRQNETIWYLWIVRKDDGTQGEEFRGTMNALLDHLRKQYGLLEAIVLTGRQPGEFYIQTLKPAPTRDDLRRRETMRLVAQRLPYSPPIFTPVPREVSPIHADDSLEGRFR